MKNLVIILFLIVSVSVFGNQNPIKSNSAIEEVSWALESARWDYDQSMAIYFDEHYNSDELECDSRNHDEAVVLFRKAIKGFRDYFPDEDLPFSEALNGLKSIVSGSILEYCVADFDDVKVWQIYQGNEFLFSVEQ